MTIESQPRFMDVLTQAARDNPLAATLIGGGALWLLFGRQASSAYSEVVRPAAELGLRTAAHAVSEVGDSVRKQAEALDGGARSAASRVASDAAGRTAAATDAATEKLRGAKQRLQGASDALPNLGGRVQEARSALSDMLERQPLVLGAVGVAIGAALAGAAAATRLEEKWAGETSRSLKDGVTERVGATLSVAEDAARAIGAEARAGATDVVEALWPGREAAVRGGAPTEFHGLKPLADFGIRKRS
jgi:hypothetical protein